MGWQGICIATSIMFVSRYIIAQICLYYIKPYNETKHVSIMKSSSNLRKQASRGLLNMLMGSFIWLSFEMLPLIFSDFHLN